MAKCRQCNVTISDDTTVCPLCRCVVEAEPGGCEDMTAAGNGNFADAQAHAAAGNESGALGDYASGRINEYPDVWLKQRRIKRVSNLILLAVLAASAVLATLNIVFSDRWWCLIPIAAMVYGYVVFRMLFVSRKGYRWKTFFPMGLALGLILIIDLDTGFYGWSLNYVFPAGILVTDLIIVILMLTNIRNWQSYMIMQIIMIAVSCVPAAMWMAGIITSPLLSLIALGISVFMFLGALILGDRTARGEMRRRFHIR